MAERNVSSLKVVSRKSLFLFFTMTSVLFLMSWFFVLRSTGRPRFIDHNLLPNSKLFSSFDRSRSKMHNQNVESSFGNRAILVNSEDAEDANQIKNSHEKERSATSDNGKCSRNDDVVLKVFMYDLPSEFHFGILDWKASGSSVWPDIRAAIPGYPGGLNLL